jgi:chloramphenicol-sensitive protein RarD
VATTPAGLTMGQNGVVHTVLLLAVGIATAVPLLLFAAGARRANLTVVGMLQFIAPILQFILGVFILHEAMPPARWAGFALVWIAIIVFVVDLVLASRRGRRQVMLEPV